MKLLTAEIRRRLPCLNETRNDADPVAQVRFFGTWSDWTWYVTEYDGDDLFFGLVQGFEEELGYFRLSDFESGRGLTNIERDLYFKPAPLSTVRHRRA